MGILSFNLFLWFPRERGISLLYYFRKSISQVPRNPAKAPFWGGAEVSAAERNLSGASRQQRSEHTGLEQAPHWAHESQLFPLLPPSRPPLIRTPSLASASPAAFRGGGNFQSLSSPLINHHSFIPVPQDIIQTPRYFSSLPLYFFARGTSTRKRIPPDKPQGSDLLPDLLNAA